MQTGLLTGRQLLANRYRNKGTAFSADERDRFGLHGLLPPVVEDLTTQLQRVRTEYDAAHGDLARRIFLRKVQENNSVLYYRFLRDHLEELLPVVARRPISEGSIGGAPTLSWSSVEWKWSG